MYVSIQDQSRRLVARLAAQCADPHGIGNMSCSIYDTAWLAMVRKVVRNQDGTDTRIWLFPQCFDFILAHQLPSGAWESYASPIDGILNTAASLLALRRRLRLEPNNTDWARRSRLAEAALNDMLSSWDVTSTDYVGSEMLVVKHLSLLEDENVMLDFPQLTRLQHMLDNKLKKMPPSYLYGAQSTLHHSLEALIGHIDFDRIDHWRHENGSMMASPSSAAAYLMHASVWDDKAEAYLRDVLEYGAGRGNGSVPCAWPTTIFELTWAVTILHEAGFHFDEWEAAIISTYLDEVVVTQGGTVGFIKGCLPDADDTAKAISALHILGKTSSVDALIEMFDGKDHFKTYTTERTPSFSANCNVLTCLLMLEDPTPYIPQIATTTTFLTANLFNGSVREKWHLKDQYWMMLLAQAVERLFQHRDLPSKVFEHTPGLQEEIPMSTLHILTRILSNQQTDGSWDDSCEITSYAILALSSLASLSWIRQLNILDAISKAMTRGKSYLLSTRNDWTRGSYLWIEKVTYACDMLSESYCLAAALVNIPSDDQSSQSLENMSFVLPQEMLEQMKKAGQLLGRTPLFKEVEQHVLRIAEMQACYALRILKKLPLEIFPRPAKGSDKHLSFIPLAFLACSAAQGDSTSLLLSMEMIYLSSLTFSADEYMERVVEKGFINDMDSIKTLIRQLVSEIVHSISASSTVGDSTSSHAYKPRVENGLGCDETSTGEKPQSFESFESKGQYASLDDVKTVLGGFLRYVLHHPAVILSGKNVISRLAIELETYLLSHVTHAEDNRRFYEQSDRSAKFGNTASVSDIPPDNNGFSKEELSREYHDPGRTFYKWVRSSSADQTSCPFAFVFFNCLTQRSSSSRTYDVFNSPRTAYLAEDLCRHLASLCRIYNDCGSVRRDMDEDNLNSVNFPEFHASEVQRDGKWLERTKSDLLWIADYERKGLWEAFEQLEREFQGRETYTANALKLFINVTDLYGQIYILKDIGIHTK